MVITKEFVIATVEGIHALRLNAREIEANPQFKGNDSVANILRHRSENAKQSADLLAGWVRRNAAQAGLNPADYDLEN